MEEPTFWEDAERASKIMQEVKGPEVRGGFL